MNEKVLRVVEYRKIIDKLTERATSAPGRALCAALLPQQRLPEIERMQQQTEDALGFLFRKGSISFGGNRDFSGAFKALAIGSPLTPAELLHLAGFLENVARVRAYGRNDKTGVEDENQAEDSLFDLFDCLAPLSKLSAEIRRCILSEEDVADDASPELKKVRRNILLTNERIHTQLTKMVNGSCSSYLQDNVVTMRDNRYCLPVKAEFKAQVPGLVHDQSQTGSTLFIEPAAVVEMNNALRGLFLEEEKEIEKVLAALSAQAAEHLTELRDDAANMTALDFIFARASLALEQNATRPLFNTERRIAIHKGRHPLIDKKKVVPIDISLGDAYDMVVITGPNTGGKTVTLKTVGLFELMGMAGLHIPAGDRSELSVFREVYADIGDEQSIEQNLSTFSAHMTTVVDILRRADRDCLCLFDELGAGTDPTEGAALAISILNFLHTRRIRSLATTHYSELKVYAMKTAGVENASCEFDVETLQPTYRLLVGVPGKSNAFAISQKLGLPGYIIETAKEQLSQETQNFEELLSDLETQRRAAQREKEEAESLRLSVERREKELRDRENQLQNRREAVLQKANEEARDILQAAKDEADQAIADLRRAGRGGGDNAAMERTRTKLREHIGKRSQTLGLKPAAPSARQKINPDTLLPGTRVRILSMGLTGTVSTRPDKSGKLFVQCGIMRSQASVDDLALVAEDVSGNVLPSQSAGRGSRTSRTSLRRAFGLDGPAGGSSEGRGVDLGRAQSVSAEINLLGKTTDEAIYALDKYLDDARLSHLTSVRVVHGKGTGALRRAVQEYLRKQKWIQSYRAGDFGEGDAGVTIVTLSG